MKKYNPYFISLLYALVFLPMGILRFYSYLKLKSATKKGDIHLQKKHRHTIQNMDYLFISHSFVLKILFILWVLFGIAGFLYGIYKICF